MHKGGTGQRWAQIEDETLQKHNLSRLRTENAPLEQTFVRPDGRAYRINLTFLAPRANLARVLASAFWITHQDGCRQATVITMAHCLRIFNRFLNDRAKSQPDLESAQRLSADLLKELAVWLARQTEIQKEDGGRAYSRCAAVSCARRGGFTRKSSIRPFPPPAICSPACWANGQNQKRCHQASSKRS